MAPEPRRPHTLIVRIWPEPREIEGHQGEWRGEVRHVPSGAAAFFRGLEALGETVREMIEPQGGQVSGGPTEGES